MAKNTTSKNKTPAQIKAAELKKQQAAEKKQEKAAAKKAAEKKVAEEKAAELKMAQETTAKEAIDIDEAQKEASDNAAAEAKDPKPVVEDDADAAPVEKKDGLILAMEAEFDVYESIMGADISSSSNDRAVAQRRMSDMLDLVLRTEDNGRFSSAWSYILNRFHANECGAYEEKLVLRDIGDQQGAKHVPDKFLDIITLIMATRDPEERRDIGKKIDISRVAVKLDGTAASRIANYYS